MNTRSKAPQTWSHGPAATGKQAPKTAPKMTATSKTPATSKVTVKHLAKKANWMEMEEELEEVEEKQTMSKATGAAGRKTNKK